MTVVNSMGQGTRRAAQVALIGNLAFLACVLLRYKTYLHEEALVSLLLILGWIMGFWVNLAVNGWLLFLMLRKRLRLAMVPSWLLVTNAVLLLVEIYFYLFI
jgi:hypothetical protein